MAQRLPTLFIPHGGGPCFFIKPMDTIWEPMAAYLRGIDAAISVRPKAVLVISGHWEEAQPTLLTAEQPSLLFDYYGFPDYTYALTYPAKGAPELAKRVAVLLDGAGYHSGSNNTRGLDHGVFIPFKMIYPEADVPILQLSLLKGLDPAQHLALGRTLAPLRDEGVLIVGSGLSYHNLPNLFSGRGNAEGQAFDDWLVETLTLSDVAERTARLIAWRDAPGAKSSHPEAEHLLPLLVAVGAAEADAGTQTYADHLMGKALSGYQFG